MARRGHDFSAQTHTFYLQFTERGRRHDLDCNFDRSTGTHRAVLHWLLNDCFLFGLPMQNWMWALPGSLLLYGAGLLYFRSRRTKLRP